MRVFVTGATGFLGRRLTSLLAERGDEVVALVRSPEKAAGLPAQLVRGDLADTDALRHGSEGCDACFHVAADYRVGVPASEREAMFDSNVGGTERVLDAAIAAGAQRIVHVSTANAFGDTGRRVVDETYVRDEADGFLSLYDETKYRSHQVALDRIAAGAPVLIAQPTVIYGPGDGSEIGHIVGQARRGKLRMKTFPELGFCMAHVDDVAAGLLLVHDRGRVGEAYVIGGDVTTMGDLVDKVSELSGRRPPRLTLPATMAKLSAPLGPLVGPMLGFPPNLREAIKASHGVTYWAKSDKAERELGYAHRGLDEGLRQTFAAEPA
jgi:dihydroflavonol-4-reductase